MTNNTIIACNPQLFMV